MTRAEAMSTTCWDVYESPLGPLTIETGPAGLTGLRFPGRGEPLDERDRDPGALAPAAAQLEQFFAGCRQAFELPLALSGTPFQLRVWEQLLRIPYGMTISYTQLAGRVGRTDIVRAVGAAVGRTPVPIIVPCHRVLGADGALTGYGGGLHRKQALLDLERSGARGDGPPPAWAFRQLTIL
jgi:methylated-DNA-[protein]-cysteine S-methyltransferase